MTHFTFLFSSNKCANYPKYISASAKYMSSLKESKLSFVKAQLYGLGFANATFYLSSFKLLVLFTSTWLPYLLDYKPRLINIFSSSFARLTYEGGLLTGAAFIFLTNDFKKIIFIKTADVAMYKFSSPQKREKVLTALLVHSHVFVLRTELWC